MFGNDRQVAFLHDLINSYSIAKAYNLTKCYAQQETHIGQNNRGVG